MRNLPFTSGSLRETGANTGYFQLAASPVEESFSVKDDLAAYQLVGEVMAHQGNDG